MLIQKLAGTFGTAKVKLMDVTVRTVDKGTNTCIVDSLDGTHDVDGLKVRLALEVCDGNLEYPEPDSTITIAFTDFTEPYMVSATWLTEKDVTVGDQCWNIQDKKQYFNSDKYGGLIIVKDPDNSNAGLLKIITDLQNQVNKLTDNWNNFCSTYAPGSPSTTGLPATLASSTVTPDLTVATEDLLVNPSVFHGKKVIPS